MTAQNGTDLAELPDARIVIDLDQVGADEWEAYDPDDGEGIVGTGETAPRGAARDYIDQVIEKIERVDRR